MTHFTRSTDWPRYFEFRIRETKGITDKDAIVELNKLFADSINNNCIKIISFPKRKNVAKNKKSNDLQYKWRESKVEVKDKDCLLSLLKKFQHTSFNMEARRYD